MIPLNKGISLFKVNYLLLDYGERIRSFMGDCKGISWGGNSLKACLESLVRVLGYSPRKLLFSGKNNKHNYYAENYKPFHESSLLLFKRSVNHYLQDSEAAR